VYTDDICSALEDPEAFYLELEKKYKFNLKGLGPIHIINWELTITENKLEF